MKTAAPRETRMAHGLLARLAAPAPAWGRQCFFACEVAPSAGDPGPAGIVGRLARPAEVARVREGCDPARAVEDLRARFARGEQAWVAEAGGVIVAAAWVTRDGARVAALDLDLRLRPDEAFLYDAYARPEWRATGAVRSLRGALLQGLAGDGVRRLHFCLRGDDRAGLRKAERWAKATGAVWYVRRGRSRCRLSEPCHRVVPGARWRRRESVSAAVLPVEPPAGAAARTRVEVFSDEHSLARLEGTWNQLVEESGIVYPFVRHEWVRRWWEAFGQGRRLHLVLVSDGDAPIALAPLMLSRGRYYGLPVRTLEFLANDHVPRFDMIVARRPAEAYRALWEHLASLENTWDVLQLQEIPSGSATLDALPRLAAADGFPVGRWPSLRSPYLPTLGSWDMYLRGLSGKQRRTIRNRMRRLTDHGPVDLEIVASREGLREALDEGLRLEDSGWKGTQGTAILSRRDTEAFYRTLAETAADRGWLRLCFLRAGGQRVAFAYTLDYGKRRYLLKVGYDPAWSSASPQNSLHALALPQAFANGYLEYDFLGSDEDWKRRWTPHERVHEWLFVFRPALRLRLVHGLKFGLLPKLRRSALYRTLHDRVFEPR